MSSRVLERLVLEHDPHEARELVFELEDGSRLIFYIRTVDHTTRRKIDQESGNTFPAPPVVFTENSVGGFVKYDLENEHYKQQVHEWQVNVGRAFLSESLDLTPDEIQWLEGNFPLNWFTELKDTVELVNGVHSAPLQDLLEDAMWSPEVAAWISTYKSPIDSCTITDTSLFREMECMVAAGLDMRTWKSLTPRERLTYLEWFTYKQAREGYQNWYTFDRQKEQNQNPKRGRS